jgi:uncharacterized protein YaaQ
MKLIISIIRDIDDRTVINQLVTHDYRVTRMASTGGFLRRGNVTLLIGVEDDQVQTVIDLIHENCSQPETGQHRATVFVVNTTHFEQV